MIVFFSPEFNTLLANPSHSASCSRRARREFGDKRVRNYGGLQKVLGL